MTPAIKGVGFVSFNFGAGRGGHYLSMSETIRSGFFRDPLVIDLGFHPTPPLDGIRTHTITHGWLGHRAARTKIREAALAAKTRVMLCYDVHAYNVVTFALSGTPVQTVYVKCGGPTLTLYYPKPQSMIVFSDEDDVFFAEKLPGAIRTKIPNRVSEGTLAIKQTKLATDASTWIEAFGEAEKIVCIARISHAYRRKIQCALEYHASRRGSGAAACLTIIGYVQHAEVLDELLTLIDDSVQILDDSYHTRDAGRFLTNFDTAITTGRGTVEAVLCGLSVLVPYDDSRKLVALTAANYHALVRTNFSGRAGVEEVEITSPDTIRNHQSASLIDRIREDFVLEAAAKRFSEFLEHLPPVQPTRRKDILNGQAYLIYVSLSSRFKFMRHLILRLKKCIIRLRGNER